MRLPIFLAALAMAVSPTVSAFAAPAASAPVAHVPQPGEADYTPEGAPRDDYNFTAWCRGVLEGHMALAEHVQSVLPLDEVQQKIGKAYLKGYDDALRIGAKSRSEAELDAANAVRFAARANWNTAMQSPLQLGADTYLAWQLPGRCEHAAKRVAKRDDIFNLAPSTADVEAMGAGTADADAPVGRAPAPVLADPAPAPIMTPAVAAVPAETAAPASTGEAVSLDALTMGAASEPMADPAPAETGMVDESALTTGAAADPVAEAAPAEETVAAAPAPAPAAAEPARDANGRLITMPRKGRLFPWGKRE